jgi:glycosyl transferase-like sugar-binding protein
MAALRTLLSPGLGRSPLRLWLGLTAFFFCLFVLLSRDGGFLPSAPLPPPVCDDGRETIPNQVHFVYVLADVDGDFGFEFSHLLSMYAAWYYWRPRHIFLHTNVLANSTAVARAKAGDDGKWSKLIFTRFDILINTVEAPTRANNGVIIRGMEHRSDFIRVKAVHDFGGVYIDWDVHALRDISMLRETGFKAVTGRQLGGQINSGVLLARAGSRLTAAWMEGMHKAYTGGWTTHSNEVLTKLGNRMAGEPGGEVLIMEREAFSPGSWKDADTDTLFTVHNDEPSNLADHKPGGLLAAYEEGFADRWERPDDFPAWPRDWSSSYMLHAFCPGRWKHEVAGFKHITPRYVLERRSNFARAVYPVARQMYIEGLLDVDDTHDGKSAEAGVKDTLE